MKNLVIGMVKGYTFEQIRPFVVTLRATGFSGDIVLIYDNIQPDDVRQMADHGVTTVPVETLLRDDRLSRALVRAFGGRVGRTRFGSWAREGTIRFLSAFSPERAKVIDSHFAARGTNLFCIRFALYFLYLARRKGVLGNVLLTDVRDVLFQRDPFDWPVDGLGVFLEDDRVRIGDCPYNSDWVRAGYGEPVLRALSGEPVSWAGVTLGRYESIMAYLGTMIEQTQSAGYSSGMDQGIHNYMLYNNLMPQARVYANGRGPVLTMGRTVDLPVEFDGAGRMLNADGTVPCILHQYDRHVTANKLELELTAESARLLSPRPEPLVSTTRPQDGAPDL